MRMKNDKIVDGKKMIVFKIEKKNSNLKIKKNFYFILYFNIDLFFQMFELF